MLSIISFICAIIGYVLFYITDLTSFPVILIFAGFILSVIDIVSLYNKEKLQPGDFVKEVIHSSWGSAIAFLAGIYFIWLLIIT